MRNLEAEMARYGVRLQDISRVLDCSTRTVQNKISGSTDFTIPEAIKIRDTFFSGLTLEYLFAKED